MVCASTRCTPHQNQALGSCLEVDGWPSLRAAFLLVIGPFPGSEICLPVIWLLAPDGPFRRNVQRSAVPLGQRVCWLLFRKMMVPTDLFEGVERESPVFDMELGPSLTVSNSEAEKFHTSPLPPGFLVVLFVTHLSRRCCHGQPPSNSRHHCRESSP